MPESIAVAVVKWGPKYSGEYVAKLHRAVARNLSLPHRFVCLTDDPTGLTCETALLPPGLLGWWNKLAIFRPEARELADWVLMLDLDIVITGSLDGLCASVGLSGHQVPTDAPKGLKQAGNGMPRADLTLTMDWWRPHVYNGACYLLRAGAFPEVWADLNPGATNRHWGDQEWMTDRIPADRVGLWPASWIASYKTHCKNGASSHPPPPEAKLVCFHGKPKPHEIGDAWVKELWV